MMEHANNMQAVPTAPEDRKTRLNKELDLFQAKLMYVEWKQGQLQQRYAELPPEIKSNYLIAQVDRKRCAEELDPRVASRLGDMLEPGKQLSHNISAAIENEIFASAEYSLMLADETLRAMDEQVCIAQASLKAHEKLQQHVRAEVEKLCSTFAKVDGYEAHMDELIFRYFATSHRTRCSERVKDSSRKLCIATFEVASADDTELAGHMGILKSLAIVADQGIDQADLSKLREVVQAAKQETEIIERKMSVLDEAVMDHVDVDVAAPNSSENGEAREQDDTFAGLAGGLEILNWKLHALPSRYKASSQCGTSNEDSSHNEIKTQPMVLRKFEQAMRDAGNQEEPSKPSHKDTNGDRALKAEAQSFEDSEDGGVLLPPSERIGSTGPMAGVDRWLDTLPNDIAEVVEKEERTMWSE